jgi:transcriptional regulator of arginine metabolism
MTMEKQSRHAAIRSILGGRQIVSQDDLRKELRKKGFTVTQATLSRDMQELEVAWVAAPNGGHYALQPQAAEARILESLAGVQVTGVAANEAVVVVKTLPGSASTVGEFIDLQNSADILGTVAGDNTLLVIPAAPRKAAAVVKFLKTILAENQ